MIDVTVVIPTRNRVKVLSELLESLSVQKAEGLHWEVLVIDNGSTDKTASVVEAIKSDYAVPLKYVYEKRLGLHSGRNRGAMEANGTVVAFLDDDMLVDEHWIQGAKPILEGQASLVGGRILPLWESPPPVWIKAFYTRSREGTVLGYLGLIDLGDAVKVIDAYYLHGGNCFISRDVILELKGYHPDSLPQELILFRGDGEFGFSLKFMSIKRKSLYNPTALAYHRISADRLSIEYFCQRAYNEGISGSFTKIRKEHKLYPALEAPLQYGAYRKAVHLVKALAITVITRLQQVCSLLLLIMIEEKRIVRSVRKSYEKGFAFHQQEVRKNPKLLEWVLREDYWGKNEELPL